ncbi:Protein of unknown function DUF58 [Paenibacillus sp. UNCCL117]|uniref:DUF58 domain-containing protein n=1 Tax=unclassified Paenibacillus TaxID=185978 RepID=UPI0008902E06|nr:MULTISPECIES: DUF58 domain-containing protein [unclassified Paenibacillus]SDD13593.1 Protein of unknown function DUF58 [Paenibacillus sp. cl123]SFW34021.1 Protein of unknown function DUF58 [Paenibacillus sp. UNCCL117]
MSVLSLIFGTFTVLAALTLLYRWRALKRLEYERHFSSPIAYVGDRIEMVERIANRKLLPLPWLRLESLISQGLSFGVQSNLDIRGGELLQNHISLFSLRPYRQIIRRHEVYCMKRGYYRLESATMTAGDPFGIQAGSRRFALDLDLLVYPKPAEVDDLPLPVRSWLGELSVRRWIVEDPFLTSGVRDYRPGDPLPSINWKATARAGALQVHRKDYTADHRLILALNLDISEGMWKAVTDPARMERGISYAASIAAYAIGRGIEVGFLCNGRLGGGTPAPIRIPPGGGEGHLAVLLETLARLELETVRTMDGLLLQETEQLESASADDMADYLLLTCHTGEKLLAAADQLRRQGCEVELLTLPEAREEERTA